MPFWKKKRSSSTQYQENQTPQKSQGLTYYHGGIHGLSVGQLIIPRNSNPQWRGAKLLWQGVPAEHLGDKGDTISITTDREIAKGFAGEYLSPSARKEAGRVYEVRPLNEPVIDPDWLYSFPEIARCVQGAEIVAVLDQVPIQKDPSVLVKALAHHYKYTSGDPVYDDSGYVIYNSTLGSFGFTQESLVALGKWPQKHRYYPQ